MDRFVAAFPAFADEDLMICAEHGVAYQADREHVLCYDEAYYNKCASYEGQQIAEKINAGRIALVSRYIGGNALVDVGIGSGEFIRKRPNTFGHDVNPVAMEWLKRNDLWAKNLSSYAGASFWDVLEHVQDPGVYLNQINLHAFVFVSIPIFYGLRAIRLSKHYRPGEHLYYWTESGFVEWMERHGFMHLETADFEIEAGRESIYSFAFKRYRR